ncbi:MAG: acyl-CoA dehydrogenase family protein [Candidatus Bathyarchaeia archaeon]
MDFSLSKEQETLRKSVREFAQKEVAPLAAETDRLAKFPRENIEKMAKLGLFGMIVPPPFGGTGMGLTSLLVAVEEIAAACASTAMAFVPQVFVEQGLLAFGTDDQRGKYLPRLARGEMLATESRTESVASSDFSALECRATPKGDRYILNGSKLFACNAGEADLYMVLVRTSDAPGAAGLSTLLIEKGTAGLEFGKTEEKLGLRGMPSREIIFEDCAVPKENLLGKEGMGVPQIIAMSGAGAPVIGTISVGIARAAMEEAIKYAKERKAFDQTIGNFEAVQFMLGDMITSIDAARLLIYRAATSAEKGQPNPIEIFSSKILSGQMALKVTSDALQIFGGYGYTKDYPLERYFRDARAFTIYPLTQEMFRTLLGRLLLKLPLPWKGLPPMGQPASRKRPPT